MRDPESKCTPTPPTSAASGASDDPPAADAPPPNVFDTRFLAQFVRQGLNPGELAVDELTLYVTLAGPWRVERASLEPAPEADRVASAPLAGWGCVPEGAERPYAVFRDRRQALLAAAILPSLAFCDELELRDRGRGVPFSICRHRRGDSARGEEVGRVTLWHADLPRAVGWLTHLLRRPDAFAHLLEAMPPEALERAGQLVAARLREQTG